MRTDAFLCSQKNSAQQIQTELVNAYREQVFPLPAVDKWHLCFADRTRELEDDARSGHPKETDFMGRLQNCFIEAICIMQDDV